MLASTKMWSETKRPSSIPDSLRDCTRSSCLGNFIDVTLFNSFASWVHVCKNSTGSRISQSDFCTLYGCRIMSLSYSDDCLKTGTNATNSGRAEITKQARLQAHTIDQFWKRWSNEYLTVHVNITARLVLTLKPSELELLYKFMMTGRGRDGSWLWLRSWWLEGTDSHGPRRYVPVMDLILPDQ